jgi:hypothetical protein
MAGRRAIQTPYSDLKMFAMMKLRLSEFYKDPTLAAGMAAMAIGTRDAKYLPYREARLPATSYAKSYGLYGPLAGQLQSAVMNIRKLGLDQAEDKCLAIAAYASAKGLYDVKIGDYSAADALLAYFGCGEAQTPTPQQGAAPTA